MIDSLKLIAAVLVAYTPGAGAFADDFRPLKGTKCGSGGKSVVVFLRGDASRGGPAIYHRALMRQRTQEGVTTIALLRPGYDDGTQTSAGTNHERRDQDTKANNDLVAKSWSAVKDVNPGEGLAVAGHTDGADDDNRWPGLAAAYIAKVKSAGAPAQLVKTSGANHWNGTLQSAGVKTMIAEATR